MRVAKPGLLMLVAVLLIWVVGGYAFHRIDRAHNERHYDLLADLVAHKKVLADATPSPRIIIAGGSNAYYGIDSHVIEERFGVPVVNFAFPFGAFHDRISLHLVEGLARPGDVVVYAASSLWSSDPWSPDRVRRAIGFDSHLSERNLPYYQPRFEDDVVPWQARPQTKTLLLALIEKLSPQEEGRSWIDDTDDRGDFTGCVPVPVLAPYRYNNEVPDAELASRLHVAATRLKSKGARLLLAMPWLLIHEDEREQWKAFHKDFVERYEPAIPVVSSGPRVILRSNREDFCDSPLHLSAEMTRQRSVRLAEAIRSYLRGTSPNLVRKVSGD